MKLRPQHPQPQQIIGIEAFRIFLSLLRPVNGSHEIWLKLGHNQFFVGDFDTTGQFAIYSTKLKDPGDSRSRLKIRVVGDSHTYISRWCIENHGGAFFIPSQPIGLPLKANVLISDDIAAELDNGTAEEQWQKIWEFVEISGLNPSYIVHSGGKSYHPHWKLDRHSEIDRVTRLKKLLAIALFSDPAVVNPHQPMRLPGFFRKEKAKYQALSYHSDTRLTLDEFEAGLARFYQYKGWIYPEVLSGERWSLCRRVINWGDTVSGIPYKELVDRGYKLPAILEEKQHTANIKTLVLADEIGEDVKNCEIRRILAIQNSELNNETKLHLNKSAIENQWHTKNSRLPFYKNNSNNPLVDFYQNVLLPSFHSLEQAFDLFDHQFVRRNSNRLDGNPGYRSTSGSKSFTVCWYKGQPWFIDWKTGECGDLIKYYWICKGNTGYPRGRDYVEILKEIADRLCIEIPSSLTRFKSSDRNNNEDKFTPNFIEPDNQEYEEYLRQEEEFEKTEEIIENHEFITWLKAQINKLSKSFKGFVTKKVETTKIDLENDLPEIIEYRRDNPLPSPKLYQDKQPPRIKFEKGDRLNVIIELKQRGWKIVWDKSLMGLGKSYDAGLLTPDPDSKHKIWYLDNDHRNVSTETVKTNYEDLNPRHDGLYLNEHNKLCVARNSEQKEKTVIPSNCHLAEVFLKFKEKGWDFETEPGDKAPNSICGNCRYHKEKSINSEGVKVALCAARRGDGYGYRFERSETLSKRQIRASINSLPTPQLEDDRSSDSKNYDYSKDIAFVEEASKVKGLNAIAVTRPDYDRALMDLATKAPDLFSKVHPLLIPIRHLFDGIVSPEYVQSRYGYTHYQVVDMLGQAPEDLGEAIALLEEYQIKAKELIATPDCHFNLKQIDKKHRSSAAFANYHTRKEAWKETIQNLLNIHANFLIPLLRIWRGERGAIRFNKNGGLRQLMVTTTDDRISHILGSIGFLVLMDTTLDKKTAAQVIGCNINHIIEVEQIAPPLNNIEVITVEVEGMKSSKWSPSCLARAERLAAYLRSIDPSMGILGLKKYNDYLQFDGYWWVANRGTNQFKGRRSIATFGTPQPNLGAAQDEYLTLFGTLEGFEEVRFVG